MILQVVLYQGYACFSTHTAAPITKMEYSYIYLNNLICIQYNLQIIKNSCGVHVNVTGSSTGVPLQSSTFEIQLAPWPDIPENI